MIVKWQDASGVSYFDGIVHVSKLDAENMVMVSQMHGDQVVGREFTHGRVTMLDRGKIVDEFLLGKQGASQSYTQQDEVADNDGRMFVK